MARAKITKNCESCGVLFEAYHRNHRRCRRDCGKPKVPRSRKCRLCGERFKPRRASSRHCSSRCYQTAWKRKKRGVKNIPFEKPCKYCGVIVPRKTTRGFAPSICDDCRPAHRLKHAPSWSAKNAETAATMRERYAPMIHALRPGSPPSLSGVSKIHHLFWVRLLEICWKSWRYWSFIRVSFETWRSVHYGDELPAESAVYRAWARWRRRLHDMEVLALADDQKGRRNGDVILHAGVLVPLACAALDIDVKGNTG